MIRLAPLSILLLAGCAQIPFIGRDRGAPPPPPAAAPPVAAPVLVPTTGRSAASLDTVSEADKAAARAAADAGPVGVLGDAVVSLGDPGDPGLWIKTNLIGRDTPGTVRTGAGDAIAVTLRPLGSDGGAQISLSALQALGLPLTGLHPVTVALVQG